MHLLGKFRAAQRGALLPSTAAARPGNLAEVVLDWSLPEASRAELLTIPTALACRNLIVGAACQIGIYRYRGLERIEPGTLLTQPDPDTVWSSTLAGTIEDLLLNGRAYWLVLAFDGVETQQNPRGLPVRARWLPFGTVNPVVEQGQPGAYTQLNGYSVAGIRDTVPPEGIIRFDSSQPGVLTLGYRAILRASKQFAAADRFADVELPAGVLHNEGTELGKKEAEQLVQEWQEARRTNMVSLLQGITYERTDINPDDLQLVQSLARVDTEIARLFNVPVSMIGASPSGNASSLQYANLNADIARFVRQAVAPLLTTVEYTLSLPSVTPRGQAVSFDIQTFLRADPEAAAKYVLDLFAADLIDRDEARGFLGVASGLGTSSDLEPGRL